MKNAKRFWGKVLEWAFYLLINLISIFILIFIVYTFFKG